MISQLKLPRLLAAALACGPAVAGAATFTVVNTSDSGGGSLRQAILDANANPGADSIHFNIPGAGPHSIQVATALPGINSPVTIDGYSQPGAAANTAAIGSNAQIRIELRPIASLTGGGLSLLVGSNGTTIRGLAINRFNGSQINITPGSPGCVITGNFIGTDPAGAIGHPGSPGTRTGLSVAGDNCRIGGTTRADRNVVSGLSGTGIYVSGDNVAVQGNLVGTDRAGGSALGNSCGISVGAVPPGGPTLNALIGGDNVGVSTPRNVVSGNNRCGIEIRAGEGHQIRGNLIGLAAFPLAAIPNLGPGVHVTGGTEVLIGAVAVGEISNGIAGNTGAGVLIAGPADNAAGPQDIMVVGNSIFGNDGLAIDLAGSAGVTGNDPLDADAGPNRLSNFPVLTGVSYTATQTRIRGRLSAEANRLYYVDVYQTTTCHPDGHGGGSDYLGFVSATTDAAGQAQFELLVDGSIDEGFAAATATAGPQIVGPTSEFSACLKLGDLIFADGFQPPP